MAPVGILALQGGYQRHAQLLDSIDVAWRWVRRAGELDACRALIIPGGESTAITRLLSDELFAAITRFSSKHALLGSCAGLILMGRSDDPRVRSLGVLDVAVSRNAYGRQQCSFQTDIQLQLDATAQAYPGVFIRAPQIIRSGPAVEVLGSHQGHPVLVAQGAHLGMSFHPELTEDARVHRYWLARMQSVATAPSRSGACA